jgi:hypothetical protein
MNKSREEWLKTPNKPRRPNASNTNATVPNANTPNTTVPNANTNANANVTTSNTNIPLIIDTE